MESIIEFIIAPVTDFYWPIRENWLWTSFHLPIFNISLWVTFFFTEYNWRTNLIISFVLSINWKIKTGYFLCMSEPDQGSILFDFTYKCLTVPFKDNWVAYLNLVYIIIVFLILRKFIHKTKIIQKIIRLKNGNIIFNLGINAIVVISLVLLITCYYLATYRY